MTDLPGRAPEDRSRRKLGKIQTAHLGSIVPVSTPTAFLFRFRLKGLSIEHCCDRAAWLWWICRRLVMKCVGRNPKGLQLFLSAKVSASLPNGVKLTLECGDVDALTAIIGALGRVQTGR
ncbi:hypothetical protein U8C32_29220 (plasmid) [Sinorhizobium medicae]|uniref:hypothetical protein n=1 Tax=Sinorhizobium medicae TaxID=110321 RepID=UPI002AF6A72E|nr:hypothetical protein [Sinorhizobium medicae]WQO48883.1 hypothetical protein U8C42_30840 [Sinorhizobium medicae]WQO62054.1 hypothetical protein U8C35_27030 [Sinorhizobium medicae]WQO76084.1 hypothetical protein U8C31_30155 [Sinorhizobium medicae]WQO95250.1 hypothetical protein U8C32_29220 [Sinorhizobium medicae]